MSIANVKSFLKSMTQDDKCPMNKDKFGREFNHKFEATYITKHMRCSDDYKVSFVCIHCEEEKTRHFVRHGECIRLGAKSEELKRVMAYGDDSALGIHLNKERDEFVEAI